VFQYCSQMDTPPALAAGAADRPLTVVYKPIDSLTPDPRNARTHPKRQIEQIVASMRAFGFTNPILADPQGNLIAGHGRLRAVKEMGLAEVPVIELAGLSDAQKKALRLADNKIALNAGWDVEILKLELADLSLPEIDIDLSLTGFSPGEIDVVLEERSEHPDEARCWMQKEPARKLVRWQNIPVVALSANGTYHRVYDPCIPKFLKQAGVRAEFIRLEEVGIRGNSHMMMSERNSDEVIKWVIGWIRKNAPATVTSTR